MEYRLETGGNKYVFEIEQDLSDKYILVCVAKNENRHIREYVQHYLDLNFDAVIIGDNNDEGDDSLSECLNDYVNDGKVIILDVRGIKHFQNDFYNIFMFDKRFKWCAVFDCDEYLDIPAYDDIKKYLNDVKSECVLFHWMTMSNNNELIRKNLPLNETYREALLPLSEVAENGYHKSIIKGGNDLRYGPDPHIPIPCEYSDRGIPMYSIGLSEPLPYNGIRNRPLSYKDGYLRHYSTLSVEECIEKQRRGYPDWLLVEQNIRKLYNVGVQKYMNIHEYMQSYRFNPFVNMAEHYDRMLKYKYIYVSPYVREFYVQAVNQYLWLLTKYEGKVILVDYELNDTMFNTVLGYSTQTANRLVCVRDLYKYCSMNDIGIDEIFMFNY